jgi:hypothetical protein
MFSANFIRKHEFFRSLFSPAVEGLELDVASAPEGLLVFAARRGFKIIL